jgi:hypothetical protein
MLRTLCQHPLLVGIAEVLGDAIRYVAIVLVVLMLLGQVVRFAALGKLTGPVGSHPIAHGQL